MQSEHWNEEDVRAVTTAAWDALPPEGRDLLERRIESPVGREALLLYLSCWARCARRHEYIIDCVEKIRCIDRRLHGMEEPPPIHEEFFELDYTYDIDLVHRRQSHIKNLASEIRRRLRWLDQIHERVEEEMITLTRIADYLVDQEDLRDSIRSSRLKYRRRRGRPPKIALAVFTKIVVVELGMPVDVAHDLCCAFQLTEGSFQTFSNWWRNQTEQTINDLPNLPKGVHTAKVSSSDVIPWDPPPTIPLLVARGQCNPTGETSVADSPAQVKMSIRFEHIRPKLKELGMKS